MSDGTLAGNDGDVGPGNDPGLAAERTDIAWGRSVLALVACAAAVVRRVPAGSRAAVLMVLVVAAAAAPAGALLARGRSGSHDDIARSRVRLRNVALGTTLVGIVCLAVSVAAVV